MKCWAIGLLLALLLSPLQGRAQQFALGGLASPSAPAQVARDDEIQSLKQQLHEQEARLRRLETQPSPYRPVAAAAPPGEPKSATASWAPALDKPTMKWFGRVHFDYWPFPTDSPLPNYLETGNADTGPPDYVGFRRLRFGVKGNVTATMLYKVQMEFENPSTVAMKDAYLGWTELPWLHTVLLGNQKRPYGLDHLNSSRYNVFMERPLVIEAFAQDTRRLGLVSYGISENEAWTWRYGLYLMDDLARVGHQRTDNYQPEFAGRLSNTLWYDETSNGRGYAHWAISGSAAFPGGGPDARFRTRPEARTSNKWFDTGRIAGGNSYQLIGLEGVVNVGSLQIVAEYQRVEMQRTAASSLHFDGGYIYVAYFLTGEHEPWERKSGTIGRVHPLENFFLVKQCDGRPALGKGAWQIAARYSRGDFSDEDILGGIGNTFTFGLNWWWTPYSRMQFNYIHGSIRDRVAAGAPATSGDYDMFGTRFMVDF